MFAKMRAKSRSKVGCFSIIALLFLCSLPAVFTQERGNTAPNALVDQSINAPVELPTTAPVEAPTNPPVELPTNTPTELPPIVPVVLPTSTPTELPPVLLPIGATVNNGANLRSGPGTDYPVLVTAAAGTPLTIVGRNSAGDWVQTDSGLWISAGLVNNAPTDLAVVAAPPPPAPAPTAVVVAAPVAPPVADVPATAIQSASCDCAADTLNCSDFARASEAQACFEYCMATVGSDIHRLDRDNNNLVCESSW